MLNRIYLFFKDEDEQDKAVKEHLEGTYLCVSPPCSFLTRG